MEPREIQNDDEYQPRDYRLERWLALIFALLFLTPDLALLVYAVNARAASAAYNLVHTTVFPIGLAAIGLLTGSDPALRIALIWFAHIGMDRAVGYGLKYGGESKVSHFSRI